MMWSSNPVRIDQGVDFGRQSSTRTSKASASVILGATRVLMGSDYRAIDHHHLGMVPMRDGGQNTMPSVTPSTKPFVADGNEDRSSPADHATALPTAKPRGAVEDTSVIQTRATSRLERKDWASQPPFGVGDGMSRVQGSFSELESHQHARLQYLGCP
ncbi:hypothetical protein [Mesorhizobium sp. 10J20-29]